jgi:hypothetical protein
VPCPHYVIRLFNSYVRQAIGLTGKTRKDLTLQDNVRYLLIDLTTVNLSGGIDDNYKTLTHSPSLLNFSHAIVKTDYRR